MENNSNVQQAPLSAYESGNPDFEPSRDCPEARGMCSQCDIIANDRGYKDGSKNERGEDKCR